MSPSLLFSIELCNIRKGEKRREFTTFLRNDHPFITLLCRPLQEVLELPHDTCVAYNPTFTSPHLGCFILCRMKPSSRSCHFFLSCASLVHVMPLYDVMSSRHLRLGRPRRRFPILGCHSVSLFVHLLSSLLATCPAHLHFASLIFSRMSWICVLFLITSFLILSRKVMCSIFLSMALCVVMSLCSRSFVVDQVSAPYVMVGSTH